MKKGQYTNMLGYKTKYIEVIEYMGISTGKSKQATWKYRCICGKEVVTLGSAVRKVKSCGCKSKKWRLHGDAHNPFYQTYCHIKTRCNPKCSGSERYGQRGIKCLWGTYEEFKRDMYEEYKQHVFLHGKKNTSIDRIDVNGHYCKENCRWSTYKLQQNNKRSNRFYTYNGKTQTLQQWADEYNLNKTTLKGRLDRGYTIKEAIEKPIDIRRKKKSCGQSPSVEDNPYLSFPQENDSVVPSCV